MGSIFSVGKNRKARRLLVAASQVQANPDQMKVVLSLLRDGADPTLMYRHGFVLTRWDETGRVLVTKLSNVSTVLDKPGLTVSYAPPTGPVFGGAQD